MDGAARRPLARDQAAPKDQNRSELVGTRAGPRHAWGERGCHERGHVGPAARHKRQLGAPTLVVSATRVRTDEAQLFRYAEVTVEALLTSACLPQLFPAMQIDGTE